MMAHTLFPTFPFSTTSVSMMTSSHDCSHTICHRNTRQKLQNLALVLKRIPDHRVSLMESTVGCAADLPEVLASVLHGTLGCNVAHYLTSCFHLKLCRESKTHRIH